MTHLEQIRTLNEMLLADMPQLRTKAGSFPSDEAAQRRLLRSLMNMRPPMPLSPEYLVIQDALLTQERNKKGVVTIDDLHETSLRGIYLWQGDITRLAVDAIVGNIIHNVMKD